jgi:acetate---CoA ligase (ADP-forming)
MSFQDFFTPKSVAIVGASRQKGKVGYEIVMGMLGSGFEGEIYPVNPKSDEIEGLRCYPSLEDIGATPDLVVIVVPAKVVPGVLRQCAKLKTGHAIIISAGFRESGEEGAKLEREAVEIARRAGIRFVGPNCLGLMCTETHLNASFGGDLPEPGKISYLSQSGSILSAILDMSRADRVGFSKLISIGNKADLNELEVLKGFGRDPSTQVIAGYLETITDGDAFVREAENISRQKPILLMKSGETGAGARAASSHTGALAKRQAAFESVFARAGIIRCNSIKSQFDYARALASQPLPQGPNVAVVANAGGAGIMAVDAIERQGLTLARFSEQTLEKLRTDLPPAANILNPVDVLGDALSDRYEVALKAVLDDPNVHTVLALLTPHAMTECPPTARVVVEASRNTEKPILASFLGARRMDEAVQILRDGRVPQYDSPESAVDAIKAMADYARWRARPKRVVRVFPVNRRKAEQIIQRHQRRKALEIGEMESQEILQAYGFLTPRGNVATSAEQAVSFARQIGYPVVLKIWSPDILHKNEVGGVKVGLTSDQEVMDAFDLMMYRIPRRAPDADILGVLIQEMVRDGLEVILGMHRDERFGPLMMFGMGGIMVEVMKDVSFYLAPITADEARDMLAGTRTYQILRGQGEEEAIDIDAVAEGLQRLSQLVTEFPQIQEMDINPYVVGPEGTTPIAVDARITLANEGGAGA